MGGSMLLLTLFFINIDRLNIIKNIVNKEITFYTRKHAFLNTYITHFYYHLCIYNLFLLLSVTKHKLMYGLKKSNNYYL